MNLVRAGQSNILSCFVFHHTSKRSEPGRHGDPAAPSVSELSLKKWFLQWTVSELYLLLTWAVTWHYLLTRSDRSSASAESILELKQNYLRLQSLKLSWLSVSMSQQSVRAWENGRRGGDCCMTSVSSFVSQHPPQLCETLWHFQIRWIITKSWDLKSSECFLLT